MVEMKKNHTTSIYLRILGFIGWTEKMGTFNPKSYTDSFFSLVNLFLSFRPNGFSLAIHDLQNVSMIFTDSLKCLGISKCGVLYEAKTLLGAAPIRASFFN